MYTSYRIRHVHHFLFFNLKKKPTILYKRYKQNPTQTNVAIQTSNCLDQKSIYLNEHIQIMNIYSHSEAIEFCLHVL